MDAIEFSNQIPSDDLVRIFKDFFAQNMIPYVNQTVIAFFKINKITMNRSSIIYSVKLLQEEDKQKIIKYINNLPLMIYGKKYTPHIYIEGDLLCITIDKQ